VKVLVLHDYVPDGAPPDQMDNLVQAEEVAAGLFQLGHQAEKLAFTKEVEDNPQAIKGRRPDVVFNLVETPLGQARLIHLVPLLLDRLGLPYTGASTSAMLTTSNKLLAKKELRKAGLPTPEWITPSSGSDQISAERAYLIKSVWEHGSVGVDESFLIRGQDGTAVLEAIKRHAALCGTESYAEVYVEGREFNVSLLAGPQGPEVLPLAEIIFEGFGPQRLKVVGYKAKWVEDSYEFTHTPRRFDFPQEDQDLLRNLKKLGLQCWRVFGLGGWARVDFRVDEKGNPWILEVNADPCLASNAGFMAAARQAGLDQPGVLARILGAAKPGCPSQAKLGR